jgi:hypothetical protein
MAFALPLPVSPCVSFANFRAVLGPPERRKTEPCYQRGAAMRPDAIQEVWGMLDRQWLGTVLADGPEPLFATISGAHLYGFASPNSDVDLRGAFVLPTLAMKRAAETSTLPPEVDYPGLDELLFDLLRESYGLKRA